MKKSLLTTWLLSIMMVFGVGSAWADDPDLENDYTLVKSVTWGDGVNIAGSGACAYTAYDTGNKKQQSLTILTAPEDAAGWIAMQAWTDKSSGKGWWNCADNGLYCVNAGRSACVFGDDLTTGWLVVFECSQTASNVITLTNANSEPDGTFSYIASQDGKSYFCTITAAENAYVGFCGNKGKGYITKISVYKPNNAVIPTTYTVKYQDMSGNTLKDDATYDAIVGASVSLSDADKANITVEGTTYIYDSDDTEGITVAEEGATVVIVKFHAAANFSYTVNEVCGETNARVTNGTSYETANVKVGYRKYNAVEGQLYKKDATSKEFNYSFKLTQDNQVENISYAAVEGTTNVVFLTEGEDIAGLTPCNSANTAIRSSNSASAYATADTKIVKLSAGTYKLHAIIYDASKEPNSHWIFKAGETQIADFNCTTVNIQEFDSEEFTLTEAADIILTAAGNNTMGLDALYIIGDGTVVPDTPTTTTYTATFTTDQNWEKVYAYAWTTEGENTELFLGAWPGTELTKNAETGLYELSFEAEAAPANIIFTAGAEGPQTADLAFEDGKAYEYNLTPALNTYTATFTTNQNWEKVYAYAWTGEGESTVKFLGDWPGTELTAAEGVYTVSIQAAEAPAKIIFNSGAGVQTEDLAFENGKAYEYNKEDSELMAKAKALAADAEAVAVGKLNAAITAALSTGDDSNLQAAIDQFKADNADVEKDETAKVKTDGWKKFDGSNAGVCATQFAPAIDTYDGRKDVKLAESYQDGNNGDVQTTGTIIYQDITGLANGSYKVGFYGNAFYTSGRGFESTMEDGATDVAYVFANDQKEFITARIATSTTENNFRQFDVEVTDGTIKLGMGKEKPGTNWHTMQIYQLTWFTTAKAAYAAVKAEMETEIASAKALKTESRTAGVDEFNAAIEAAEAAFDSNMLNVTEFEAELAKIKAAAAAFKKANWYIDFAAGEYYIIDTEGGKMMAAGHDYGTRGIVNEMGLDLTITPYTESRTVTIDSRVANGNNHFLGENLYMDSSEWGWALEYQGFGFYILEPKSGKYINLDDKDNLVLSDTPREFIIVTKEGVKAQRMQELAEATAENPVDATFLIKANNFNRNDARNAEAWTVSEDCTNKNLSGGADANRCAESYHSTFTISQAISGAPAGKYTLTAQGFFRQDKNANEVDTVETTPIFFIGDKTAEVPAKTGTEDNMKQASESFTAGQYTIEPIEFVYNGEGDLVVGIKNETAKYQWIIFDNFQLTYYGPTAATKYTVAVAETQNGEVKTDKAEAAEGETVTVTVTPAEGFKVDEAYWTTEGSETKNEFTEPEEGNAATFTMPAANVTVTVTFKAEEAAYNTNVTYALKEGDTFKSGQAVEVKNNDVVVATITYGEAGDGAEDFKAAKADGSVEGFAAFTEGNGVNGNKAGGTFYTIVPNYDGEIEVAVVLNADKAFYVEEDGTALEAYNGIKVSEKYFGTYTFNVTANKAYKVYCAGSKLGFYGFNYKYNAEVTPEPEKIESMYIMGELTGGWDFTDSQKMTQDAENAAVWTLTVEGFEAEAKTYKYKATANAKWGVYELPASGDYTFTFGTEEFPAGKYNLLFTVNTTDGTLTLVPTKVVPDGINSIAADRLNGTIYNLNGQKVLKAQKGMYIINGKKVVKK